MAISAKHHQSSPQEQNAITIREHGMPGKFVVSNKLPVEQFEERRGHRPYGSTARGLTIPPSGADELIEHPSSTAYAYGLELAPSGFPSRSILCPKIEGPADTYS